MRTFNEIATEAYQKAGLAKAFDLDAGVYEEKAILCLALSLASSGTEDEWLYAARRQLEKRFNRAVGNATKGKSDANTDR